MINKSVIIYISVILFSVSISLTMIASCLSIAYAKGETITEPRWYEANVILVNPVCIRTGAPGLLRFSVTPLIEGDFEFKVRFNFKSELINSKGSAVKVIKASKSRPFTADFEFKTTKPVNELFTVEFSTAYPRTALVKILETKYGKQLYEVKNLINKINLLPDVYSATLPIKLIITDSQCALNPMIYFEKNNGADFFNIKPSIDNEDAVKKVESFKAKYEGIFELSGSAFDKFIRRTDCDFIDDLNDYFKGLHACYYFKVFNTFGDSKVFSGPDRNIPPENRVVEFIGIYNIYLKDHETKKNGSAYNTVTNSRDSAGDISIYIAAFYNLRFTEKFKSVIDSKNQVSNVIKDYEAAIKLLVYSGLYSNKPVNDSLTGYLYFNLAVMYKKPARLTIKDITK